MLERKLEREMGKQELNPTALLEALGIDDYAVDYETNSVYLPEKHYYKLVEYFSKSKMSHAIIKGGWRWCKGGKTDYPWEAGSESSPKSAAV